MSLGSLGDLLCIYYGCHCFVRLYLDVYASGHLNFLRDKGRRLPFSGAFNSLSGGKIPKWIRLSRQNFRPFSGLALTCNADVALFHNETHAVIHTVLMHCTFGIRVNYSRPRSAFSEMLCPVRRPATAATTSTSWTHNSLQSSGCHGESWQVKDQGGGGKRLGWQHPLETMSAAPAELKWSKNGI